MNWFRRFWKALRETAPETGPQPGAPADSSSKSPRVPTFLEHVDETTTNFTPRAQQVLALARKEADRFRHNFVGTEHVLLGLIALGQGTAVNVLTKLGLDLESVRAETEKQVGTGPDQKIVGVIPYTPRVKKVLALARKEARALNHTYTGTEHILLGLLREGDGVAARVLQNFKIDIEQTRQTILKEIDPDFSFSKDAVPGETQYPDPAPMPDHDSIDTTKRYDIYCNERTGEAVVYRSALFKSVKTLQPRHELDYLSQFAELELADGQTIYVARSSIIKFCKSGDAPKS